MFFNVKKCKVLHIGHNNAYYDYSMNGEILQSVKEETDLGIIVSNDLKPSKQCVSGVKKANMTLGIIKHHCQTLQKPFETKVRILYTSMKSAINQRYRTT